MQNRVINVVYMTMWSSGRVPIHLLTKLIAVEIININTNNKTIQITSAMFTITTLLLLFITTIVIFILEERKKDYNQEIKIPSYQNSRLKNLNIRTVLLRKYLKEDKFRWYR